MIDIILASYNGAPYVPAQIDSLLNQSSRNWRLTIRDDGSLDDTLDLCRGYARRYPDRIHVLEDNLGNLGFLGNFARLLASTTAPYVMYCDQDDVWLPEKVELSYRAIRQWEDTLGPQTPVAVYTDAQVVASDLTPISNSLLRYIRRVNATADNLPRMCMAPPCYGCTMILNRPLARLIDGYPRGTLSHDWWTGLVASAFGRLAFLDCAPILHRRHSINLSTTTKSSLSTYLRQRPSISAHRHALFRIFQQSAAFLETFRPRLSPRQLALFTDIARIPHSNWIMRRALLVRHGLYKTGFVKNLGMMLVV